jgi:hypothetical protein
MATLAFKITEKKTFYTLTIKQINVKEQILSSSNNYSMVFNNKHNSYNEIK